MDFAWSNEQQRLHDAMLAALALIDDDRDLDRDGGDDPTSTRLRWKQLGALGALGLSVPEADGGGGLDPLTSAYVVEALGKGHPDLGLVFGALAHLFACAMPIAHHGDAALRRRLLPALCTGELIAANAITEDEAGSDVAHLRTTARRIGDYYVLDGEKSFVSNGPIADVFVVYATVDPGLGHLGTTAFVVERHHPGLATGDPFTKMGLHGCQAGRVTLSGCDVPVGNRLGPEGAGNHVFTTSMHWERACLFAAWLGMLDRQLGRCVARARQRVQHGQPIGRNQAVSHRLADMALRLDAARLLLYRACWALASGAEATSPIAMAKLAVSEAAVASSLDAIQIFGGQGYLRAGGIECDLRDSVPTTVFSGTSEVQRDLIARGLGL